MLKYLQFAVFGFVCFILGYGIRGMFESPVEQSVGVSGVPVDVAPSEAVEFDLEAEVEESEVIEPASVKLETVPVAQALAPADAILSLQQVKSRARYKQELQNMVLAWIEGDAGLSDADKDELFNAVQISALKGEMMPEEVSLTRVIGQLSNPDIRTAWKASNVDSPMRAAIFAELAAVELEERSPVDLLSETDGWTPWERTQYSDTLLTTLAQRDLDAAFEWGVSSSSDFGSGAIREMLTLYSRSDPDGLEGALAEMVDPRVRAGAIEVLAARRVMKTEEALMWADSLPTPEEQALAHDVIYEMTPRGIGVSITSRDGFPQVTSVVRSGNGLRRGDRIVGIIENGGEPINTFGRSIDDVVKDIRGEPGTDVTVQVLRGNAKGGGVTQVETVITREQLYFE